MEGLLVPAGVGFMWLRRFAHTVVVWEVIKEKDISLLAC